MREHSSGEFDPPNLPVSNRPQSWDRAKTAIFGPPRRLDDQELFQKVSLVALLAWIGLGSDGLSSSAYGPEEAFRALGGEHYLALALAGMVTFTIAVISLGYSRIIEEFPHGGGGYVVATKLLGPRLGVVSGAALVVDYVLTIAVSIASAGDAIFSFLPIEWHAFKLPAATAMIVLLSLVNLRGVKESVLILAPIFGLFLLTHVPIIIGGIVAHAPEAPAISRAALGEFKSGISSLGVLGMVLLFFHSYSLGGGTFTGIEAVSNGMAIMREPRVQTGRRTMLYMALSLAFVASGILVCYYLYNVTPTPGQTLNASFFNVITASLPHGRAVVWLCLLAEGMLLIVGAQTGFLDGPRVLANLALDSWAPHSFASLSERLTIRDGILLMGGASIAVLLYARGNIHHLVVMYSINVFLTFSLSMLGMARHIVQVRATLPGWRRRLAVFIVGFVLCAAILVITSVNKFAEGGWVTLVVTLLLIGLFFLIRRHYRGAAGMIVKSFSRLEADVLDIKEPCPEFDPTKPTAALLVSAYGGLGIHSLLHIFRMFPGYFHNLLFLSVGVVDSGGFKGKDAIDDLRAQTEANLKRWVELSRRLGVPAQARMSIGTDVTVEAEKLCLEAMKEFPHVSFFAGKIVFPREGWIHRLLHNDTSLNLQKRLQHLGLSVIIVPATVS